MLGNNLEGNTREYFKCYLDVRIVGLETVTQLLVSL
jgi:hypothetical protein